MPPLNKAGAREPSTLNSSQSMSLRLTMMLMSLLGYSIRAHSDALQSYEEHIKPMLKERCFACHGSLKQKGGLRLDTAMHIRERGAQEPLIDLKHPDQSILLQRLRTSDMEERMPPEGKAVDPAILERIEAWIAAGAPGPSLEEEESDPSDHWSFHPPVEATITTRGTHPIDALLQPIHEEHEVEPQAISPPLLLMRRLFLDLVGTLPEPEEIAEYVKEPTDQHYEKIVDRLLASPHYGERWGRHWMDIWRYSDWFGLGEQLRYSQKHIWHWRDWIVESLNEDKGYDQMILEMLAADELFPLDEDRLRATGFLARNYFLFNRTTWLDKTIEHTARAFVGLTLQCSKCHDHKYDPITAEDYYRFRAILEPHQIRTDALPGEIDLEKNGLSRAFDMHPDAATFIHVKGDEKNLDQSQPMSPSPPAFLGHIPFTIQPVSLPPSAHLPALKDHVLASLLQKARVALRDIHNRRETASTQTQEDNRAEAIRLLDLEWEAAQKKIPSLKAVHDAMVYRSAHTDGSDLETLDRLAAQTTWDYDSALLNWKLASKQWELEKTEAKDQPGVLKQIEALKKDLHNRNLSFQEHPLKYVALKASIKALESPAETEEERGKPYPDTSTGRRSALARWLIHPENPLTARVAVNHMWSRHFGIPLVDPVSDFGRRTPAPILQSILDHLAVTLVKHQWHMKPIHRLIVTSAAYKRSSASHGAHPQNLLKDPENQLLWRQHTKRMESQVIRDSLLKSAGLLDERMGGPSLEADKPHPRRSLYFRHSRDDQERFLGLFDDASILECYRRSESIIPQQALALSNSQLSMDAAMGIAHHLGWEEKNTPASEERFIERAFQTLLGWEPEEEERDLCRASLKAWKEDPPQNGQPNAGVSLIHSLMNHNDFITIR